MRFESWECDRFEVKEAFLGMAVAMKSFYHPDFLASREEVELTDAIRAQAAALNHNPIECTSSGIYARGCH